MLARMKTTLDLPDDILREMKLRALMKGRTLRDLVADFLRQGLGMTGPRASTALPADSPFELGADGIPIFRGKANAPALHMNLDALQQLEHDALTREDMQRAGISF
jgi:plasmid stability protein